MTSRPGSTAWKPVWYQPGMWDAAGPCSTVQARWSTLGVGSRRLHARDCAWQAPLRCSPALKHGPYCVHCLHPGAIMPLSRVRSSCHMCSDSLEPGCLQRKPPVGPTSKPVVPRPVSLPSQRKVRRPPRLRSCCCFSTRSATQHSCIRRAAHTLPPPIPCVSPFDTRTNTIALGCLLGIFLHAHQRSTRHAMPWLAACHGSQCCLATDRSCAADVLVLNSGPLTVHFLLAAQ
jgi:hypothetical protein